MKKIVDIVAQHVTLEPGDRTRYEFIIIRDAKYSEYLIVPDGSTFDFPDKLSIGLAKTITSVDEASKLIGNGRFKKSINPHTLYQVANLITELEM